MVLADVGKWGSGGTPSAGNPHYYGGSIPWLNIEDLNDAELYSAKRTITEQGLQNSSAKIVPPGTLLVAMYGASIGKLGIAEIPCATNQAIAFCQCDPKILTTRFLFYYLLAARPKLIRIGRGGAQPNISQEILKELSLSVPSLAEQNRVANLLYKADRLRRARRYALELTDTFLPAAFLELFGDPKQNPNGWPQRQFSAVCSKFSDGPFGSNLKSSDYRSSGVRVVRLQNIGVGEFLDDDKAFVSKEHFAALQKHSCFPGDVLIGTMGDPNLRACRQPINIPIALNKADCIQARPDPKHLNALYLQGLLNIPSTLHLVPGMVHGQTRARVSMGELARLTIPVPPLPLQQKFAALVERVERLRAVQRQALRQAEHLFASLLHRAFSGEL